MNSYLKIKYSIMNLHLSPINRKIIYEHLRDDYCYVCQTEDNIEIEPYEGDTDNMHLIHCHNCKSIVTFVNAEHRYIILDNYKGDEMEDSKY